MSITDSRNDVKPYIALDYVIRNERLDESGIYNDYISAFTRMPWLSDLCELTRRDYSIKQLMNHKSLKKEITETFGALCLVEKALRRRETKSFENTPILEFSAIQRMASNIVFYDICCGKGISSFLISCMFTHPKIIMVDSNSKIKMDHLNSPTMSNTTFKHLDIFSNEFVAFLEKESSTNAASGKINIIIGLHLCGHLSTRVANVFNDLPSLSILVLSPCCMPRKGKGGRNLMKRLRENRWDSYSYWCLSVYTALNPFKCIRDMVCDSSIESEKSTIIWALKRDIDQTYCVESVSYDQNDQMYACDK